ncbi:MAG: LysM peptidoglycan-binding domain-containing protein [Actinomycetota bacterium]|nr:LysM peptidoglycan-binding domain-containing protein [Actinomycetota bacterium]
MFALRKTVSLLALLSLLGLVALGAARPSTSASEEARYRVRPGDTLWAIAEAHYEGDPREAVWRIKERNGLKTPVLTPGALLALPP